MNRLVQYIRASIQIEAPEDGYNVKTKGQNIGATWFFCQIYILHEVQKELNGLPCLLLERENFLLLNFHTKTFHTMHERNLPSRQKVAIFHFYSSFENSTCAAKAKTFQQIYVILQIRMLIVRTISKSWSCSNVRELACIGAKLNGLHKVFHKIKNK